jgi:hypothetical protein
MVIFKGMAKQKWFKENCAIEALKYTRPVDFQKGSPSAEQISRRKGWFDEITTHMIWERESWTREKLIALVEDKKYKSMRQLQLDAAGAYKAIVRLEMMDEIRSMMPELTPGADKIKPLEEVIAKIKEAHGDLVTIVESTYARTSVKAKFIDKNFGMWETWVGSVMAGRQHPDRVREQIKKTNLERYGFEHPMQNKILRAKADATVLERYGTKNISSNEEIKAKKRATTLKNFGTEYPSQNETVRQKQKDTNVQRYGVTSPMHDPDIALRNAKSLNNHQIKYHWKTNEEIVCLGSYESKTVDYLNINKTNYEWQSKIFEVPIEIAVTEKGNPTTYRPDLYLPEQDVWVEIKGYMRGDAQAKWDWFKSEHPTAQLWDKEKLKEIGIL